jgi:hypothetical protein
MSDVSADETSRAPQGEARWPIVVVVAAVITLTVLRPAELRLAPAWVLPTIEVVLLGAVIATQPPRVSPRAALWRPVSICAVMIVVADVLAATARLIGVLIHGGHATTSADQLLTAGAIVWGSNVAASALLYWLLDGGGAAAREKQVSQTLDFAFPQHLNPEIAPAGWRPRFGDYLYLGFNTSTAFSPTDVMPLAPWAKLAMAVQSLISLAVIGLVIARAVNVFT